MIVKMLTKPLKSTPKEEKISQIKADKIFYNKKW